MECCCGGESTDGAAASQDSVTVSKSSRDPRGGSRDPALLAEADSMSNYSLIELQLYLIPPALALI